MPALLEEPHTAWPKAPGYGALQTLRELLAPSVTADGGSQVEMRIAEPLVTPRWAGLFAQGQR